MRWIWVWGVAAMVWWVAPTAFEGDGIRRGAAILMVLLVAAMPVAVFVGILRSLPNDVLVRAVSGNVTPQMRRRIEEFERLGFERFREVWRFELPHPAYLVALVKPDEDLYATVYRVESTRLQVAYDVVTMLDPQEGALTTGMDHSAGVLPSGSATFRQLFQDAEPAQLLAHHRQALVFLSDQGIRALGIAPSATLKMLKLSFVVARRWFLLNPVRNTLVAIARTMTKRNPYLGTLSEQPGIGDQLARVSNLPRSDAARPREVARVSGSADLFA